MEIVGGGAGDEELWRVFLPDLKKMAVPVVIFDGLGSSYGLINLIIARVSNREGCRVLLRCVSSMKVAGGGCPRRRRWWRVGKKVGRSVKRRVHRGKLGVAL